MFRMQLTNSKPAATQHITKRFAFIKRSIMCWFQKLVMPSVPPLPALLNVSLCFSQFIARLLIFYCWMTNGRQWWRWFDGVGGQMPMLCWWGAAGGMYLRNAQQKAKNQNFVAFSFFFASFLLKVMVMVVVAYFLRWICCLFAAALLGVVLSSCNSFLFAFKKFCFLEHRM